MKSRKMISQHGRTRTRPVWSAAKPGRGIAEHCMSSGGNFVRKDSSFRDEIKAGGKFPPEKGRYHLIVSLACPWAHRALIVRRLKGLQDIMGKLLERWTAPITADIVATQMSPQCTHTWQRTVGPFQVRSTASTSCDMMQPDLSIVRRILRGSRRTEGRHAKLDKA